VPPPPPWQRHIAKVDEHGATTSRRSAGSGGKQKPRRP
jgi:hypothetical protein